MLERGDFFSKKVGILLERCDFFIKNVGILFESGELSKKKVAFCSRVVNTASKKHGKTQGSISEIDRCLEQNHPKKIESQTWWRGQK